MKWTLNQASKETGIAKATILRAIERGQMSAPKNDTGGYEIDAAEFHRVFDEKIRLLKAKAETDGEPGTRTGADHHETLSETSWLEAELKRISELLKVSNLERDRERSDKENEIRFLRARIEAAEDERESLAQERRVLTAQLLTYQKPPEPPAPPSAHDTTSGDTPAPAPDHQPVRRGFFGLFRKAS